MLILIRLGLIKLNAYCLKINILCIGEGAGDGTNATKLLSMAQEPFGSKSYSNSEHHFQSLPPMCPQTLGTVSLGRFMLTLFSTPCPILPACYINSSPRSLLFLQDLTQMLAGCSLSNQWLSLLWHWHCAIFVLQICVCQ